VICLVRTYRDQTPDSPKVIAFRDELKDIYDNTFIISEKNAQQLNANTVSTHFLDKDGVVKYFRMGSSMTGQNESKMFDYILSHVTAH
jgi:hypothetical protein